MHGVSRERTSTCKAVQTLNSLRTDEFTLEGLEVGVSVGSGAGRSWKDDKFPGGGCHAPAFALRPEPLGVFGELLKGKVKKENIGAHLENGLYQEGGTQGRGDKF